MTGTPFPKATTSREPIIVVNGILLPTSEAMTIRVALESFYCRLTPGSLGNDEHGTAMVRLYKESIEQIRKAYA